MNIGPFGIPELTMLVVIAYWLSFGFFCGWLAREKGREDDRLWFILGLLFNFVALITLVGAPALEYEEEEEEEEE